MNIGVSSWYDFARAFMALGKLDFLVYPIEIEEYLTATKRPHFSLLKKGKINKHLRIDIPY